MGWFGCNILGTSLCRIEGSRVITLGKWVHQSVNLRMVFFWVNCHCIVLTDHGRESFHRISPAIFDNCRAVKSTLKISRPTWSAKRLESSYRKGWSLLHPFFVACCEPAPPNGRRFILQCDLGSRHNTPIPVIWDAGPTARSGAAT